MTVKEKICIVAGLIIIYIIYLIVISIIRKNPSKTSKKVNTEFNLHNQQQSIKNEPRYQLKPSVTSLSENFLNEVLTKYCKNNNLIHSRKVKLADFLNPINTQYVDFDKAVKQSKSVYVDFLISANSNGNFEPIAAVILDDQWICDISVEEILEETDLEVFRFDELDEDRIINELNYRLKEKIQYFKYLP